MSDWLKAPPAEWERRLREISPVTDRLAHLRFRYREAKPWWYWPEAGVWEIYTCTPKHLASAERANQFARRWQDMPIREQAGRKAVVTSYQYFMWHTHNVEATRFWVLHGPNGGVPARYTDREVAYLDAMDAVSIAPPLGFFPPCEFDERTVQHLLERDRLVQAGMDFDRLEALDRPEMLKAQDEENARMHRERYLEWWAELMGPCKEFMKSQIFKEQQADLPPAPVGLANKLATWKEQFIHDGTMDGAQTPTHRTVNVPVTRDIVAA